jgi:hypothetical protein
MPSGVVDCVAKACASEGVRWQPNMHTADEGTRAVVDYRVVDGKRVPRIKSAYRWYTEAARCKLNAQMHSAHFQLHCLQPHTRTKGALAGE